jgi:hypothetical protein
VIERDGIDLINKAIG